MRPRLAAAVLSLAASTLGCTDTLTEPPHFMHGVVSLFVSEAPGGGYRLRPEAAFFNAPAQEYPDSRVASDTCRTGPYAPTAVTDAWESVDAGARLELTIGGATVHLERETTGTSTVLYAPISDFVTIAGGSEVSLIIPGVTDGFPSATVTALTPVPLAAISSIPATHSTQEPLAVTWDPPGDATSRLEISLQYATESSAVLDRHTLCSWRDDGAGVISPQLLVGWSNTTQRRIEITRFRTYHQLIGEAVLFVLTTYDVTVEPTP